MIDWALSANSSIVFFFLEESAVCVVAVLLCSGGALCMDNQIEVFVRDREIKK
jgi:hypothetical protein